MALSLVCEGVRGVCSAVVARGADAVDDCDFTPQIKAF